MTDLQTYGHPALQALNATFSKEQAETLLALLAAVGGSDWDSLVGKPATFPPTIGTTATTAMAGNTPIPPAATWANLAGKPAVIAEGATQAAARTAIGAGTSSLVLGTGADQAMPGNTTIPAAATWANLPGKPAVIGAGADAAAARTAIGAGTGNSNLAIGTTASTAAAGNHTHAFSALAGTVADVTGANLQAILEDLAGRIADLEEPEV